MTPTNPAFWCRGEAPQRLRKGTSPVSEQASFAPPPARQAVPGSLAGDRFHRPWMEANRKARGLMRASEVGKTCSGCIILALVTLARLDRTVCDENTKKVRGRVTMLCQSSPILHHSANETGCVDSPTCCPYSADLQLRKSWWWRRPQQRNTAARRRTIRRKRKLRRSVGGQSLKMAQERQVAFTARAEVR